MTIMIHRDYLGAAPSTFPAHQWPSMTRGGWVHEYFPIPHDFISSRVFRPDIVQATIVHKQPSIPPSKYPCIYLPTIVLLT